MSEIPEGQLVTKSRIAGDLQSLGVKAGMTLLVHSSLSSLGWVCGGPQAVIEALFDVLGPRGTLVMPTHSSDLTDPETWQNPPVPADWWQPIRDEMPAFDSRLTPTRNMGIIAETFRKARAVKRSSHPVHSFAAFGRHRDLITDAHSLDNSLGEGSPLARVYDLDGHVLLLGVDHDRNTSLHLAEYRYPTSPPPRIIEGTAMIVEGRRKWVTFKDINHDEDDFLTLGKAFEDTHNIATGHVGQAPSKLMSQPLLVDFARTWMRAARAS